MKANPSPQGLLSGHQNLFTENKQTKKGFESQHMALGLRYLTQHCSNIYQRTLFNWWNCWATRSANEVRFSNNNTAILDRLSNFSLTDNEIA